MKNECTVHERYQNMVIGPEAEFHLCLHNIVALG